ncbi:hypothetical protein OROHE_022676 [Orobanche hederae]
MERDLVLNEGPTYKPKVPPDSKPKSLKLINQRHRSIIVPTKYKLNSNCRVTLRFRSRSV